MSQQTPVQTAKPLAAVYIRVSTQDQAQHGFSLDAQEESLLSYAKALGYEVYKVYKEEGKSGKNLNRPEMQDMLKDAQTRKFQTIFIYKLDRFSRSLKDLILTLDQLKNWGVDFISLQDKIETASATGKLMFQIIGAFAEFERNIIGDRTKFTMERKAKEGGFITRAPLGYDLINKQLVENKETSQRVRQIFEEYLKTEISLTQLAKKNRFTTSGIKKLLSNTTYLGKVKFANIENEGKHQPIVEKDLFDKVQEKLK